MTSLSNRCFEQHNLGNCPHGYCISVLNPFKKHICERRWQFQRFRYEVSSFLNDNFIFLFSSLHFLHYFYERSSRSYVISSILIVLGSGACSGQKKRQRQWKWQYFQKKIFLRDKAWEDRTVVSIELARFYNLDFCSLHERYASRTKAANEDCDLAGSWQRSSKTEFPIIVVQWWSIWVDSG